MLKTMFLRISGSAGFHLNSLSRMTFMLMLLVTSTFVVANLPAGYYNNAEGRSDAALKNALHQIISQKHKPLLYDDLRDHFRYTDWHPDGYFWDMYSREKLISWNGSRLNREHCMPKSWFGISSDMEDSAPIGADIHNIYPSNVDANTKKSNFPLGVVDENYQFDKFDNGVSKVGYNTFPGYSGKVFEPANQYKGDFARTYMYMVTRYEDYSGVWRSTGTESMLNRNTYPVFNSYAVTLLMKWHRDDPVSQKELNRNDSVFKRQGNRNPYIDFPLLAEFIWGNSKGKIWDAAAAGGSIVDIFSLSYRRDELQIRLSPASEVPYRIYSIEGRQVLSGDLSGAVSTIIPVNGRLQRGVYLFITETERQRHAQLFVVM